MSSNSSESSSGRESPNDLLPQDDEDRFSGYGLGNSPPHSLPATSRAASPTGSDLDSLSGLGNHDYRGGNNEDDSEENSHSDADDDGRDNDPDEHDSYALIEHEQEHTQDEDHNGTHADRYIHPIAASPPAPAPSSPRSAHPDPTQHVTEPADPDATVTGLQVQPDSSTPVVDKLSSTVHHAVPDDRPYISLPTRRNKLDEEMRFVKLTFSQWFEACIPEYIRAQCSTKVFQPITLDDPATKEEKFMYSNIVSLSHNLICDNLTHSGHSVIVRKDQLTAGGMWL